MLKEYEIWIEGYQATGERDTARFIGRAAGSSFGVAVVNFMSPNGDQLILDSGYDLEKPRIWGRRLFDNEFDARKSFG